jgi:hypothetical protein
MDPKNEKSEKKAQAQAPEIPDQATRQSDQLPWNPAGNVAHIPRSNTPEQEEAERQALAAAGAPTGGTNSTPTTEPDTGANPAKRG